MKVKYIGKESSKLSLIRDTIYTCLGKDGSLYRVIDETGEDYLYPVDEFIVVEK